MRTCDTPPPIYIAKHGFEVGGMAYYDHVRWYGVQSKGVQAGSSRGKPASDSIHWCILHLKDSNYNDIPLGGSYS